MIEKANTEIAKANTEIAKLWSKHKTVGVDEKEMDSYTRRFRVVEMKIDRLTKPKNTSRRPQDSSDTDSDVEAESAFQHYNLPFVAFGAAASSAAMESSTEEQAFYTAMCTRIHRQITSSLLESDSIDRELFIKFKPESCIAAVSAVAKRAGI